ncbi:hypothetical protein HMPREF2531_04094 [Bacteroides intestinalis]|uniref:Uncharacterized protein n=1 Tax=Bacteroides intestinalis TaxID=329854 RepID=A0A139KXQ4_9BACE|nr:hypothetical protein HMPREF2531_04094 [Bacteroides intestinalis]
MIFIFLCILSSVAKGTGFCLRREGNIVHYNSPYCPGDLSYSKKDL